MKHNHDLLAGNIGIDLFLNFRGITFEEVNVAGHPLLLLKLRNGVVPHGSTDGYLTERQKS